MTINTEKEIEKTYSPKDVEDFWYKKWDEGKYFKAKPGKANQAYTIIMPPPNVTGKLHAGHALDITTQDAIIRFKRMKGFEALFLPGMDHAGIATQSVVEKMLFKKEGKTKHDFTREEFLAKIWQWKEEYGGVIVDQQKKMGASPDWDYSVFTLDKGPNEAVNKCFVELYNEGLIYQSDYIINWDPVLQSAISDAEVEHLEVKGNFYHLLYKIKNSSEFLEIATTRPETLLGDTAVSVHPNDERFKHLIGKTAIVPICNREVPILGDEYVEMGKGTGCLKVTPGHDFNDFEIGKRHNLEIISILNKDATLNDYGLEFKGLSVKKARQAIVEKLEKEGVLIKIEPHVHQVGHGDRSKAIIEPLVSKQWFMNTDEMAKTALQAVENGQTKFYPKGWENTYFSWLKNPKNWCISRQLIWGHQIPIYYCRDCDAQWAAETQQSQCRNCHKNNIFRDPDVLDTWFSSGLWPLSTLGWPNPERMQERKFDTFFPTTTLVTGFDIIFFWVARMMMMTLKATNNIPFSKIYIHAIVTDKMGRKMSKSLNNGLDPIDVIEQYGADAFRFTLAAGSGYNRNLNLDPEKINGHRNFINKVWNAFRFIHPFLDRAQENLPALENLDHHERWILSEFNSVAKNMNNSLEEFRFDDSCAAIYSFVYDKFCSWFIEVSKNILHSDNQEKLSQRATVLKFIFKKTIALMHPFTPYITEELWSYLKDPAEDLLIVQEYPEFSERFVFTNDQEKMNQFIEVISCIRNIRSAMNIKPKEEVAIQLFTDNKELSKYFSDNHNNFYDLARTNKITIKEKSEDRPGKSSMLATTHTEIFLQLEGVIDLAEQITRLSKELNKTSSELQKLEKKLANTKFVDNAPDEVINEVKKKARAYKEKALSLEKNIENFKA